MKLTEAQIEKACSDILSWDGWRSLKTDPVSRREWGKGFGEPGMADRLYIRFMFTNPMWLDNHLGRSAARVMWIEWKSARGKPKPHQTRWHEAERARGALTLIAGVDFPASIEGFTEWYKRSGLMRRTIR